jgi:hypothetical protein
VNLDCHLVDVKLDQSHCGIYVVADSCQAGSPEHFATGLSAL